MNWPDRTNGRTYPRAKRQPRSEKYDRSLRKTRVQPCQPAQVTIPPMLNHGLTMPHFGATTSSRLGGGRGTCSGTRDPCHCHKWTEPYQATALEALREAIRKAAQRMSIKGPGTSTIIPLLEDMALLTMNRVWDTATCLETTEHLCAIMSVLAHRDPREDAISRVTDTSPRPKHKPGDMLPLHIASNGIGAAGSIPIAADV